MVANASNEEKAVEMMSSTPQSKSTPESIQIQLDREDIILLVLEANQRLFGKSVFNGITRLEKIIYLLTKETGFEGVAEFYPFEAHNFGPFSMEIYQAVEFLESCDLVTVQERGYPSHYAAVGEALLLYEISTSEDRGDSGESNDFIAATTEKLFALTDDGGKVATIIRAQVHKRRSEDTEELDAIMARYANLPLSQLIRYVYHRYPEMTGRSIHPEAANVRRRYSH